MKTLYFECNMGAAGDMLMAALLELHEDAAGFLRRLNEVGIPKVTVTAESAAKCGIMGTYVRVKVDGCEEDGHSHGHSHDDAHSHSHEHPHTHGDAHAHAHSHDDSHAHGSFSELTHLINHLSISPTVKQNALAVYRRIAQAESHAHGVPVEQIHFHEVGEMDAVADIVGVCMLMEELAPQKIICSPVNVGSGHVRCSHGILPVPAPATAFIFAHSDCVIYADDTQGELCTPTGAAILTHFAEHCGNLPPLTLSKIGYGMGTKNFKKANCVRVFLVETAPT